MNETLPTPAGPATQAVLDDHRRQVAAYRRWSVVVHGVTALLVLGSLVSIGAGALNVLGLDLPWYVTWSPLPVLIAWLFWKDDLLRIAGRPARPRLSHQRWALALETDRTGPREFGALPPGLRVYRPENR